MRDETFYRPLGDDPPKARLIYGVDVREGLRMLPDASVQMIATSPPYWGLRDYGTEPEVWGGDKNCDHDWGAPDRNPVPPGKRQCRSCGRFGTTSWSSTSETTTVCSNCGIETEQDEVETRGILLGVKDSGDTENWTSKKSEALFTSTCRKCGAWLGQLGREPTPKQFVAHLVEVFREARRVLRDDGVLWLNLGDTYFGSSTSSSRHTNLGHNMVGEGRWPADKSAGGDNPNHKNIAWKAAKDDPEAYSGLKPKDLVGIPWRVALALQEDGWYLRSDIIWAKSSCMPEPVRDRPTKTHEYVFLLTKNERYFYDQEAIKEASVKVWNNQKQFGSNSPGSKYYFRYQGFKSHPDIDQVGRNKRSVWTISPKPYAGAHFATWPEELVEPMVKAGSARCQVVLDPFSGSSTTGAVALRLGRNYIGLDLNESYFDLAAARLEGRNPPLPQTQDPGSVLDLFE